MTTPQKANLFYTEGSSDKVYNVSLEERNGAWAVIAHNGKRGKALKEGVKLEGASYEAALKAFNKVVKEKTSKGYTYDESGAVFASAENAGDDLGLRLPLFNEITEAEARQLGPDWLVGEKHDGERRPMVFSAEGLAFGNRKGQAVGVDARIAEAGKRLMEIVGPGVVLDGEDMGDHLVIFDVLQFPLMADGTFRERAAWLENLEKTIQYNGLGGALRVEVPLSAPEYFARHFDRLKELGSEGVVARHANSKVVAGRPASGGDALKVKNWVDCSCRVAEGREGKRSVGIEVRGNDGAWLPVGNVTIPPNANIPEVGKIIDVRYLYAYKGGSLFQPQFTRERNDLTEADCGIDRLKFKADAPAVRQPEPEEDAEMDMSM